MRLVVIGGQSRGVGKTSLVASIIAANPEVRWTAFKITQYGHGVCSSSGEECGCAIDEPDCSYSIEPELNRAGRTDTSRFLRAGAAAVFWVRTRVGQLRAAMPALRRLLRDRDFVIMESNSILGFLEPDLYIPVLHPGVPDFKESGQRYLDRADAYAIVSSGLNGFGLHLPQRV